MKWFFIRCVFIKSISSNLKIPKPYALGFGQLHSDWCIFYNSTHAGVTSVWESPFLIYGDTMNIQGAINRLSKYYPLDASVCMVLWLADDVIKQAKEQGVDITPELAAEILESLDDNHDANYGITWETIDAALDANAEFEKLKQLSKGEKS